MYKFLLFFIFVHAFAFGQEKSHSVLVSVAPYKYFVHKIAGETVQIALLVPPGASPHYFEPSAKQVLVAGKADIWFRMGEGFEEKALAPMTEYNQKLKVVDLRDGIDLLYEKHTCCSLEGEPDPHIWMSPRSAKKQAENIAKALILVYPEHQELYQKNLRSLQEELEQLDTEIAKALKPYQSRYVMVSHPAYAYYCRDYGLTQLPIEFEGKDPSPKQLTNILTEAHKAKIHTIFIQQQHSSKGATLIAKEIGAKVEYIDPLREDYIKNMQEITRKFVHSYE